MPEKQHKTKFSALTQAEAAFLLGCSPRWMRDHPDVTLPARDAATGLYDGRALVKLIRKWEREQQQHGSPKSPALEQWRRERTKLTRIQRLREERKYVPLAPIREFHNRVAALMRRARERLELRLVGEAVEFVSTTWEDLFDDIEQMADDFFGSQHDPEQECEDN